MIDWINKFLISILFGTLILFSVFCLFSISVSTVALLLGALVWALWVLINQTWGELKWPLLLPFGLYFLACFVSLAFAVDFDHSITKLKKLSEPLIFFWIVNVFSSPSLRASFQKGVELFRFGKKNPEETEDTSPKFLDILVLLFLLSSIASALYGYYQKVTFPFPEAPFRPYGTLNNPMTYSGVLMMALALGSSRLIFFPRHRVMTTVGVAIVFGALLLTLTRSAWIGFLTAVLFLLFIKNWRWIIIVPILLGLTIVMAPQQIQDRIFSMNPNPQLRKETMQDQSYQERLQIWSLGMAVFQNYPWTGCGFDCVYVVRNDFIDDHPIVRQFTAQHSNILQLMVDVGILGLMAWLVIWVQFFRLGWKQLLHLEQRGTSQWIVVGSLAAILSFLVEGLVESNFFDTEVAMVVFFLMALPFSIPNGNVDHDGEKLPPSNP